MKKKIFSLLGVSALLALVIPTLAACGSKGNEKQSESETTEVTGDTESESGESESQSETEFESEVTESIAQTYNVTINAVTGGNVTVDKGEAEVGENIAVTVTVDDGYRFNGLNVNDNFVEADGFTKNDEVYVTSLSMVEGGLTLEGVFAKLENIVVSESVGGTIAVDKEIAAVGEEVVVSVTTNAGNAFLGLDINGTKTYRNNLKKGTTASEYLVAVPDGGLTLEGMFLHGASELTIELDYYSEDDLKLFVDSTIDLPEVLSVKDENGFNVKGDVEITVSDLTDSEALFDGYEELSNVVGVHTIRYEVKLGETVLAQKDLSVLFARRLIKEGTAVGDWGTVDELKPNDEQTVTLTNNGMAYLQLNMAESNYYYVEFQVTNQSWGGWVGFAHGHGDYVYSNEMLKTVLVPSTNGVGRGYPNGNMWSDGNTEWHEYLDDSNYQFNGNYIKFGVARVGEYFYTFINDQYEGATQADGVSNVATKAAFWANAYSAGNEDLVLSKIVFLKDEISTRNKVAALLDGKMMKPYVANTAYWSHNPSNFEFGKSNELGEYVKVLANNINQNSSIVSNWITYYGDFTFEFDYKFESTSLPSGDDAGRLQLELRPRSYGGDVIQFGCKYSKGQFMMDPTSDPSGGVYTTSIGDMTADLGGRWGGQFTWAGNYWGGGTYDDSQGTHYKIVRTFDGNGAMTIKATFNSIASPSMTWTRTFTIANPTENSMRVTITNKYVKGVISNITYTI